MEEDTRYKKHFTQDSDASVPFKVGTLGTHTALPFTISFPVVISWILSTVWNLFPFKGDFSLGKSQKLQKAKSGLLSWLSHMGNLMFHQKSLHKMWWHEQAHCHDEAANHPLPRAVAFWVTTIVFMEEYSSLMQNLMQICGSTHSKSFWMQWPHSTHAHSIASTTPTD